jgi:hypothetical protein
MCVNRIIPKLLQNHVITLEAIRAFEESDAPNTWRHVRRGPGTMTNELLVTLRHQLRLRSSQRTQINLS